MFFEKHKLGLIITGIVVSFFLLVGSIFVGKYNTIIGLEE